MNEEILTYAHGGMPSGLQNENPVCVWMEMENMLSRTNQVPMANITRFLYM